MSSQREDEPSSSSSVPQKRRTRQTRASVKTEKSIKDTKDTENTEERNLNSPSSDDENYRKAVAESLKCQSPDEDLKEAMARSLSTQSSDDEDLKKAMELSKSAIYIDSDNDEDVKKALKLSLQLNGSTIVISDDEFDDMCKENKSLNQRLAKSEAGSSSPRTDVIAEVNQTPKLERNSITDTKGTQTPREQGTQTPSPVNDFQEPQPSTSSYTTQRGRGRRQPRKNNQRGRHSQTARGARGRSRAAAYFADASISGEDDEPEWRPEDTSVEAEEEFFDTCGTLLGMGGAAANNPFNHFNMRTGSRLTSEEATKRMRTVFERGLESKLDNEEMEACRAVKTKLHPHQKAALAWMVKQENKEHKGMLGGILADEMGLGKTLTVLSLIMTNHYDGKPLAKPKVGFTRSKSEMGRNLKGKAKMKKCLDLNLGSLDVGKSIKPSVTGRSAFGFFSKFAGSDDDDDVRDKSRKFSFGDVMPKKKSRRSKSFINDDSTDSEASEEDEFDAMLKNSSSKIELMKKSQEKIEIIDPREEGLDELYDEWQNLSEKEKHERVQNLSQSKEDEPLDPALNLDGAFDSSSEDEDLKKRLSVSCDNDAQKRTINSSLEELQDKKKRKFSVDSDSDQDVRLSDIDLDECIPLCSSSTDDVVNGGVAAEQSETKGEKSKCAVVTASADPDPGPGPSSGRSQIKRIIPPKDVAVRGKRPRPTLILCPTSLINHWCSEIDNHIDSSVDIKVKVHHGQNKARLGADLNTYDVVISTYGTLAKEYDADVCPLTRAKWIRVVLDEGHTIKNRRAKTTRAANQLDCKRRWVITGTPIQNNLTELWSLVNWLQFDLYADNLPAFVMDIERPCKNREPSGFERLQTLMDTICLRRTKNDKKSNGEPMVVLPKKNIILRDVTFNEEEKLCYAIIRKEATEIVLKYQRRGELLRNYAHIFALMTRMRQLCCHRELIKAIDWNKTLKDKEALERELARFMEVDGQPVDPNNAAAAHQLADQLRTMIRSGVTEDCSICLDDLNSPVITPCAHVFCRACIERVLETLKPPACPLCRGSVRKQELLEASVDEEEATQDEEDDTTLKDLANINFNESSSKVNAALKEMIRIRETRPDDKIILVSQFTSFLSMFQPLLQENGFKFVRLDGTMSHVDRTEVVNIFQKKTPCSPKVLLLSLKAGGVGLNLTAANHLLLLDPAWNPAAEWQCFDRIHRIGQDKEVFIYKYITKEESIEEKMMAIQAKKEELISGAFHMPDEDRRRQRINDILNIFNLAPRPNPPPPQN